jgi:hypothetical protein
LYLDNVNITNNLNSNTLSASEFGVYPNPIHSGETLYFDLSENINKVDLINSEGKLSQRFFNLDQNQIAMPMLLKDGIYKLIIYTESYIFNSSIVIH